MPEAFSLLCKLAQRGEREGEKEGGKEGREGRKDGRELKAAYLRVPTVGFIARYVHTCMYTVYTHDVPTYKHTHTQHTHTLNEPLTL